jgi:hypothetical protein
MNIKKMDIEKLKKAAAYSYMLDRPELGLTLEECLAMMDEDKGIK